MREQAFKIALLTVASHIASAASALPAKPHHKPAPAAEGIRYALKRHEAATLRREAAPLRQDRRDPSLDHQAHPIRFASAPEPEPAAVVPLPEIHVTHNRKIHYTASPSVSDLASSGYTPALPEPSVAEPALPAAQHAAKRVSLERTQAAPDEPRLVAVRTAERRLKPSSETRAGKTSPATLKGSKEILLHQNEMADREGLDRIQDEQELHRLRTARLLVPLPASSDLAIDDRLPADRRYCRPWTAEFLTALSRAYARRFHSPLQVNSAVRTVEFQERLRVSNGNAAPAEGQTASPHLTGQAIDLAKHGLSATQIAWLRGYLLPLVQSGKIDVEEEFQQACFHISVYRKYTSAPTPNRAIAERHSATSALAAAVR